MRKLALLLAAATSFLVGVSLEGCSDSCVVGSEGCDCTSGGGCDPGLTCLSMTCVNAGPMPFDVGDDVDTTTETSTSTGTTGTTSTTGTTTDTNDTGTKLDMGTADDGNPCVDTGCKKVDMLFALDGSLSMIEEINALKAGAAFLGIVDALENLNCGGIDYRIGVTGDNDNGWVTPNNWASPNPWFDSSEFTAAQISVHFQAAATKVGNSGGASLGCEHVLSSAVNLLGNDQSSFMRDDALLVLVLMSDVDDYGWYDQLGGNSCGVGCNVAGQPVQVLQDTLVALKGGDSAGVSTIVIAGDPMSNAGDNFCGQPQSCGAPTSAFHAERLYEFASIQGGMNGYVADICDGAAAVPTAVQTALTDNIDLACQEFEPVG